MISYPENLWLGGLAVFLAIILSTSWAILTSITPGTARRLEDQNQRLADKLGEWLNHFDQIRASLHVLLIGDMILLIYCSFSWLSFTGKADVPTWITVLPFVASAIFYLFITEWTGRHACSYMGVRYLALTLPFVRTLGYVASPLVWPVVYGHRKLARLSSSDQDNGYVTAEDEIKSLVEEVNDERTGTEPLSEQDRSRIQGIFDLNETLVKEIMTPRVDIDSVSEDTDINTVKDTIVACGHSRIPVYRGSIDHVVGVVYAKELLNDEKLENTQSLSDFYHPPAFIPETRKIGSLLHEFQQTHIHIAIVIDEYGGTSGVVTVEDILEEIVGEIRDEYDMNEPVLSPQHLSDGSILLDARTAVHEANEALDLNIPESEDYDTVGGYIVAKNGKIPHKHEKIENGDKVFEVTEADPRRVLQVKISPRPESAETQTEHE